MIRTKIALMLLFCTSSICQGTDSQANSTPIIPCSYMSENDIASNKFSFLDIHPTGIFLKKDGKKLIIYSQTETGVISELKQIEIPKVEDKILFDTDFITTSFIQLSFGIPSESPISYSDSENESIPYEQIEYVYYDIEKEIFFRITSPDFKSYYPLLDGNSLDTPRILIKEQSYMTEGEHENQDRLRYYDLSTQKFELIALDFHNPLSLIYKITDGRYTFNFVEGFNLTPPFYYIQQIAEKQDGTLIRGDIKYQEECTGKFRPEFSVDHNSNQVIIYKTLGAGYRVPYLVDLSRKNPVPHPLLTDDEMDDLTSDVYKVQMSESGRIEYTTHFEERKTHIRHSSNPTDDDKAEYLLDSRLKEVGIDLNALDLWRISGQQITTMLEVLSSSNIELAQLQLTRDFQLILKLMRSPQARQFIIDDCSTGINRYNWFLNNCTSIKTADGKFNMPIYWTQPEILNPEGYFIIEPHGGPHHRQFNEFNWESQFWTSRNYPYVWLNIRGSTGLGISYEVASDGHWWDVVDDVKSAIDWARAQGLGTKPIIMGTSFGAYAAAACYAKGYTDFAVAINGVYDFESDLKKQPITSHEDLKTQFGTTPEIRAHNSIAEHMPHRPNAKMVIVAGLKDTTCFPDQSTDLKDLMTKSGNPVELLTMADEGHTVSKPENRLALYGYLETCLGNATGYPNEGNGYSLLATTPGIYYERSHGHS